MVEKLEEALVGLPVKVTKANDSVTVTPKGVDKGIAVVNVMDETTRIAGGDVPGMVVCIGDSAADEPMFKTLHESVGHLMDEGNDTFQLYTVTVGKKASEAEYFVNSPSDLEELLTLLSNEAGK